VGQGILPFQFEPAPRPMDLTAHAGLTLVSETLLALGLDDLVCEQVRVRVRRRGDPEFDKLQAIVLIQAAGGECVEDVRVLAREGGLTRLLHRPLPAPDALHDFLGTFHDEPQMAQRPGAGAWIPPENAALQALGRLNTALIQRAVAGGPRPDGHSGSGRDDDREPQTGRPPVIHRGPGVPADRRLLGRAGFGRRRPGPAMATCPPGWTRSRWRAAGSPPSPPP
jgi:hypothetical protein